MMMTDYQAKYFAYELTQRYAPDSAERLAGAVAGAQVDLNPHQVDAALFAFASPLSKGALLADEVGLGKTIEAGLVISQRFTGPNYGDVNSLLLVISGAIPTGDVITLTFDALAPITFTSANFVSTAT